MHESPLQVDDPFAAFRVQCPVCRQNVWAGQDPPPAEGDDLLSSHDCPGPADVASESMVPPPAPPVHLELDGNAAQPVIWRPT